MAEMWYYTCEGKQMDPVSIKELKRLVGDGILKPTDMVWKDGMPRWIRASSLNELFPDPVSSLDQYFTNGKESAPAQPATAVPSSSKAAETRKSSAPVAVDEPAAKKKRRGPDAADDDRPTRRRGQPASSGSNVGIVIALILGAGVLLVALVVGVIILIVANQPRVAGPIAKPVPPDANARPIKPINPNNLIKGELKYTVKLAPQRGTNERFVSFRKGAQYTITVQSQPKQPNAARPGFFRPDVDIHIYDSNGAEVAVEDSEGPNANLLWSPLRDGEYRVELINLDDVILATSNVTITETNAPPVPPAKEPPALPPGAREGTGVITNLPPIPPGQEQILKFRVKGGQPAFITVVAIFAKADSDLNVQVFKDSDGSLVKEDVEPLPNAMVNFTLPETTIIRVRVHNASKTATSRCTVQYSVGN